MFYNGQMVIANTFSGPKPRVVVEDLTSTHKCVTICTLEEFRKAKEENRKPVCIGFPPQELIPSK